MEIVSSVATQLEEFGLIAIIRANFETDIVGAAHALVNGGFNAVEITLNTPGALEAILKIRQEQTEGVLVGAGTILCEDDAARAFDAGAQYIVTPTLQLDTIKFCRANSLPIFSGCFTPTEALTAYNAGSNFIKLFPSSAVGPSYISAMLAPLPFLKIFPTGGITVSNLESYLKAGCIGVAIGNNLVSKSILQHSDWHGLAEAAKEYATAFKAAQKTG